MLALCRRSGTSRRRDWRVRGWRESDWLHARRYQRDQTNPMGAFVSLDKQPSPGFFLSYKY